MLPAGTDELGTHWPLSFSSSCRVTTSRATLSTPSTPLQSRSSFRLKKHDFFCLDVLDLPWSFPDRGETPSHGHVGSPRLSGTHDVCFNALFSVKQLFVSSFSDPLDRLSVEGTCGSQCRPTQWGYAVGHGRWYDGRAWPSLPRILTLRLLRPTMLPLKLASMSRHWKISPWTHR